MTILVTKPLHPLAFHLYSHHYRFHNIWMFNHRLTTKYFLFFDLRLLGNKIFYRILREKLLELTVKLSRQCLIVRNDESSCAMTFAIVNVLPEPVTPSKVSNWLPSLKPFTSSSIACGWSPVGLYGACSLKICCSFCTKVTSGVHSKSLSIFEWNIRTNVS